MRYSIVLIFMVFIISSCNVKMEDRREAELTLIESFITNNEALEYVFELKDEGIYIGTNTFVPDYSVKEGDSLSFYYYAQTIAGVVYETNVEAIAIDKNLPVTDKIFDPIRILYGEENLIAGLSYSLAYLNQSNKFLSIIPFDLAYGGVEVGILPSYSTVVYVIDSIKHTSVDIKKELSEIIDFVDETYTDNAMRGVYKKQFEAGNGQAVALNDTVFLNYGIKTFDGIIIDTTSGVGNINIVANFEAEIFNDAMIYSLLQMNEGDSSEFVIPSYLLNKGFLNYDLNEFQSLVYKIKIDSIK